MNDIQTLAAGNYRQLFELSPMPFFVLDRAGKVLLANPAASRLLGEEPAGLPDLDLSGLVAPDSRETFAIHINSVFESGLPQSGELVLALRDGRGLSVAVESQALPGWDSGQACLSAMTNLAGRMCMEEDIRSARDAAERASQAKSVFLANMSHEIRTPMNAILGMTRLLKENSPTPEQLDLLTDVENASVTLLGIVNDILDFSRIEAGRYDVNIENFDFWGVLNSSMRTLTVAAGSRQLPMILDIRPDTPRRILSDSRLLVQILVNLMSNALKFTSSGQITVKAWPGAGLEHGPDGMERRILNVAVADTGIGISVSELGGIFDPFSQADPSATRRHGGAGLGLAISKRLADLLGGTILVESAPGKGSTFTLSFPAGIALPAAQPVQPATPSAGAPQLPLNVLLAEDNELNKRLAQKFLGYRGHRVTAVSNGREALDALARERFDLVLMDVSMPVMDGVEATRTIRAHDGSAFDPKIPIVAVTAHAVGGDRERFLEAGMDAYLSKPLDLEQFERVIQEAIRIPLRRARGEEVPQAEAPQEDPFDTALQAQRFASMKDFLPELLALYRKNAVISLDKLRAAVLEGNLQAAYKEGHTLKGMASVVCASVVQRLAGEIEAAGKKGDSLAVRSLLAELEIQVERSLVNGDGLARP